MTWVGVESQRAEATRTNVQNANNVTRLPLYLVTDEYQRLLVGQTPDLAVLVVVEQHDERAVRRINTRILLAESRHSRLVVTRVPCDQSGPLLPRSCR